VADVQCKTCKMNTYQADDKREWVNHDNEADDCIPCLKNLFSKAGDPGCSPCAAGKTAGTTECVKCVAGQVSSSATDLKCAECVAGKYQDQEGLPSCTECLPGQYQDVGGEIQCKQCPKGQHDANSFMSKYRDASTVCEDCECIYIQYIMYIQ